MVGKPELTVAGRTRPRACTVGAGAPCATAQSRSRAAAARRPGAHPGPQAPRAPRGVSSCLGGGGSGGGSGSGPLHHQLVTDDATLRSPAPRAPRALASWGCRAGGAWAPPAPDAGHQRRRRRLPGRGPYFKRGCGGRRRMCRGRSGQRSAVGRAHCPSAGIMEWRACAAAQRGRARLDGAAAGHASGHGRIQHHDRGRVTPRRAVLAAAARRAPACPQRGAAAEAV